MKNFIQQFLVVLVFFSVVAVVVAIMLLIDTVFKL